MPNIVLILTEESMKRVYMGLGELQSKISHQVIMDIDAQNSLATSDVRKYVELIDEHLKPYREKIIPEPYSYPKEQPDQVPS